MSRSNVEEIIALLWTIACIQLWAHGAPFFVQAFFVAMAISNHATAIAFAVKETRKDRKS